MRRAGFLLAGIAGLAMLVLLARGEKTRAASSKPNVIMFTTDDQTFRDMAVMTKTQALIGNQGASFLHAYASDPLCCPSRVTVQTGDYAHNTGVLGNTPPAGGYSSFNDKNDLPVWLQADGYRTIHIGKMPNGFGEVTNADLRSAGLGPVQRRQRRGSKGRVLRLHRAALRLHRLHPRPERRRQDVLDRPTTRRTSTPTSRSTGSTTTSPTSPNTPLYMQVQFFAPHDPATPEPKYANAFATAPLPIDPSFNEKNVKDKPAWIKRIKRFGPGLIAKIQTRYQHRLETLLSVDDAFEKIVNDLQARGVLDNTYLIFTSDQGLMQGQHRLHQGKFVAYDPSTQVPLLIRGPGIPAGSQPRALVWNGDITSTILPDDGRQAGPAAGRAVDAAASPRTRRSSRPGRSCSRPGRREPRSSPGHRGRRQGRAHGEGQQVRQEPRPRPHGAVRAGDRRAQVPRNPDRPLPVGQVRGRLPRDV